MKFLAKYMIFAYLSSFVFGDESNANLRGIDNQLTPLQNPKKLDVLPDVIRGINWFGYETEYKNLMCTWVNDIDWNLSKMKEVGFNYIRLPFSAEFVKEGNWDNMDLFFEKSHEHDMNVVLDFHRLQSTHQSYQPYDELYTFDDFLLCWKIILLRYQKYDNLKSIDIFNEYQGSNYVEWNNLARQIVNYIEKHFPGRFEYFVGGTNWGGNIHYMDLSDLEFRDRIRYSIHKYWFSDSEPYEEKWNYSFGDHPPVVNVGEWGYKSDELNEVEWASDFVNYLIEKDIRDTFFWTWSFNSGDTGGILREDCANIDIQKMVLLHHLWYDEKI